MSPDDPIIPARPAEGEQHGDRAKTRPTTVRDMAALVQFCPECGERLEDADAEAERVRQLEQRHRDLGLPEALRGIPWDAWGSRFVVDDDNRRAVEACQQWSAGESRGLLLLGPTGSGKTALAATAVWQRVEHDRMRWVSVAALIAKLMGPFTSDERRDALALLTGPRVGLVLDDMDKAKPSEFVQTQLFLAVDSRVQAGTPLLVTTNLAPSELAERFGEPVASRLVGYCERVKVGGADRRTLRAAA